MGPYGELDMPWVPKNERETKLNNGLIPAFTLCPFMTECGIAKAGSCHHKSFEHRSPFSCATARARDLVWSMELPCGQKTK